MMHEHETSLSAAEVLARARGFFTERVPQYGATLERDGPTFAIFRGQGGEELVLAVSRTLRGTRVRGSTLLFDQAIGRFFSTLPVPAAPDTGSAT